MPPFMSIVEHAPTFVLIVKFVSESFLSKSFISNKTIFAKLNSSQLLCFSTCACIRMVENDKKHLKMMIKVPFSSCTRETHERLALFSSFSNVFVFFDHANACASMLSLVEIHNSQLNSFPCFQIYVSFPGSDYLLSISPFLPKTSDLSGNIALNMSTAFLLT